MSNEFEFKVVYNRVSVYMNGNVIKEFSVNEFNKMCKDIELIRECNPVLFNEDAVFFTIDDINAHKYKKDGNQIGNDFTKDLIGINIRPIYFYKQDLSYLFFDFIYNIDSKLEDLDYGIKGYNVNSDDVVSICIENHNKEIIKSGYVPNSYLCGILDNELRDTLLNIENIKIMINGDEINANDFWDITKVTEYDTLFSNIKYKVTNTD